MQPCRQLLGLTVAAAPVYTLKYYLHKQSQCLYFFSLFHGSQSSTDSDSGSGCDSSSSGSDGGSSSSSKNHEIMANTTSSFAINSKLCDLSII